MFKLRAEKREMAFQKRIIYENEFTNHLFLKAGEFILLMYTGFTSR